MGIRLCPFPAKSHSRAPHSFSQKIRAPQVRGQAPPWSAHPLLQHPALPGLCSAPPASTWGRTAPWATHPPTASPGLTLCIRVSAASLTSSLACAFPQQHLSKLESREFPGGPVVRAPRFHCRGAWVRFLVRELGSRVLGGVAKKKKTPKNKKQKKTGVH